MFTSAPLGKHRTTTGLLGESYCSEKNTRKDDMEKSEGCQKDVLWKKDTKTELIVVVKTMSTQVALMVGKIRTKLMF